MRLAATLSLALTCSPVFADDDQRQFITDQLTKTECGACHFAYPASMLPEASWRKIMSGLEDHFGEDASLESEAIQDITEYLVSKAADTKPQFSKYLRGIDARNPPVRITETEFWIGKHFAISKEYLQSGLAGLKAVCIVCHLRAEDGYYEKR